MEKNCKNIDVWCPECTPKDKAKRKASYKQGKQHRVDHAAYIMAEKKKLIKNTVNAINHCGTLVEMSQIPFL
jgi:hypothetical protein